MHRHSHPLPAPSLGVQRDVVSLHFGVPGAGPKVYLQAGLHADELPGMLVLHHLAQALAAAEQADELIGEVIVVPVANPIGLGQSVLREPVGRFALHSGDNFNRGYPELAEPVRARLAGQWGNDGAHNIALVRAAMRQHLAELRQDAISELDALRLTLLSLACDADVVVDVHADTEAIVHLYTETPYWPQAETLARCLGSEVNLLARGSGVACSFDEACSQPWWQLAESLPAAHPLPLACLAVTLELRGQTDVDEKLAQEDAIRLLAFLRHRGVLRGEPPPLPPLPFPPTPLAGSETVRADRAGLVTFLRPLGDWVDAGEPVCELLDPINGTRSIRRASVAGRVYARTTQRYAMLGMELVKIAGSTPFRTGALLTA